MGGELGRTGDREALGARKGWVIRSGASTGWRCTLHLVECAECSQELLALPKTLFLPKASSCELTGSVINTTFLSLPFSPRRIVVSTPQQLMMFKT